MRKFLIPVFFILGMAVSAEGHEVRNGGGGIRRLGKVLTFGSVGMTVTLKELRPEEIPGMPLISDVFKTMDLLPECRVSLQQASLPSLDRKYYRIDEANLAYRAFKAHFCTLS